LSITLVRIQQNWVFHGIKEYQPLIAQKMLTKSTIIGILRELRMLMTNKNKKHGVWTLAEIQNEAKKYKTRCEFKENSGAYQAAGKRKIINQVCSHMPA